ncbi:outer membrane protein assembly factor BamE [Pseudomonas sp. NPDC096917]|uniref:outer membrane protein assembly factor BamE domain-containing protein n=1 Tax=Pseudomonas sp. NPDC096917 TaxID=3364483 RepID=UPI00383BEDEC
MLRHINRFILGAIIVALAGCAGTPFTFGQASKVKIGMTEDQLYEIMGNPYMTVSKDEGQTWVYTHATAFSGAKSISFETKNGVVSKVPYIPKDFLPND